MSATLEQDYIGLSAAERSPDKISTASSTSSNLCPEDEKSSVLDLKETELRLGLPGSLSPERKDVAGALYGSGVALLFGKSCVSGFKRGFSDAIDGSGKWNLSINSGDSVRDDILFASLVGKSGGDGVKNFSTLQSCLPGTSFKEVAGGPVPLNPIEDKKKSSSSAKKEHGHNAPASKTQVLGWPPIRSFRKNTLAANLTKNNDSEAKSGPGCLYVKVSMDGAPYLRKVDLKTYSNYSELSSALEMLFSCFTIGQCSADEFSEKEGIKDKGLADDFRGSEHVLTYEDKDGDWMLVGDVPWEMFIVSCKRLRIMRGSEAIGLAPRAMQKAKDQS